MSKKSTMLAIVGVALLVSTAGMVNHVSAATTNTSAPIRGIHSFMGFMHGRGTRSLGVFGKVASVNGTTITVTGKNGTTYTVDAANATLRKDKNTTILISDIKVGDMLVVRGTVNGTSVTATNIFDGIPMHGKKSHGKFQSAHSHKMMNDRGQPSTQ